MKTIICPFFWKGGGGDAGDTICLTEATVPHETQAASSGLFACCLLTAPAVPPLQCLSSALSFPFFLSLLKVTLSSHLF